ncbi:hypothetical protein F4820DRAFT_57381 [Hypoxylon rubiginosum]|uniref:Uncharacterized protein n=1 Tax=Hypoxylon rubiginosum TaxID=110542 RepID=A0ACB9YQ83_9PEZI|nr:hypothetical protein F4820DRAFT_57381 [Hypoxylon rubiginosum]
MSRQQSPPSPPPPYTEDDNASIYQQPPPPYSAAPPPYTAGAAQPNPAPVRPNPVPAPARRSVSNSIAEMPNVITAYWPKKNVAGEFCLGESPDKLLFRISRGRLSSIGPLMALYVGPGENGLALGKLDRLPLSDPAHETTVIEIYTPRNQNERSVVQMTTWGTWEGLSRFHYYFSMAVGLNNRRQVEKFEWRPSRGGEVQSIDPYGRGWKLVRLGVAAPTGGKGGGRSTRPIGETSDGMEVVAIWVTNPLEKKPGQTPFQFELRGNGKNGALGKHFGFVALMTALRIWCVADSTHPRDIPSRRQH